MRAAECSLYRCKSLGVGMVWVLRAVCRTQILVARCCVMKEWVCTCVEAVC